MILYTQKNHPHEIMIIVAKTTDEHKRLTEFARPKETLIATIEHGPGCQFSHLLVKKGPS